MVWAPVDALVKQGLAPTITLSYKDAVKKPKGKPGRPKKHLVSKPYGHLLAAELFNCKLRPRCINPNCKKRLTNAQVLTCSDVCKEYAMTFYLRIINLLAGRAHRYKEGYGKRGAPSKPVGDTDYARALSRGRGRPAKGGSNRGAGEPPKTSPGGLPNGGGAGGE